MNSEYNELLDKIKVAVFNPQNIHIADERRVACIFYNLFKQKGPVYADGFQASEFTDALPHYYSKNSKAMIRNIIEEAELEKHISIIHDVDTTKRSEYLA